MTAFTPPKLNFLPLLLGLLFGACNMLPCGDCCGEEEEESLALSSLPASVRSTILQYAEGREIGAIEFEVEDGVESYGVELEDDEVEFNVTVDGQFLGYEVDEEEDDEQGEGRD